MGRHGTALNHPQPSKPEHDCRHTPGADTVWVPSLARSRTSRPPAKAATEMPQRATGQGRREPPIIAGINGRAKSRNPLIGTSTHARHKRAVSGYLETGRRIGVWPDSVQVLGEALSIAAAHRCHWCGSLMACVLVGHRARRGSKGVCPARSSYALPAYIRRVKGARRWV